MGTTNHLLRVSRVVATGGHGPLLVPPLVRIYRKRVLKRFELKGFRWLSEGEDLCDLIFLGENRLAVFYPVYVVET